jgi:hypothetical protein
MSFGFIFLNRLFFKPKQITKTWLRAKVRVLAIPAGKLRVRMTAGKVRVRAKLAGKASTETTTRAQATLARKPQPLARCLTGFFCSTCEPDYIMALAMGTHERLGQASPLANLTDDLLRKIIDGTKPRRQVPAWMSCTWSARKARKIARTAHSSSGV